MNPQDTKTPTNTSTAGNAAAPNTGAKPTTPAQKPEQKDGSCSTNKDGSACSTDKSKQLRNYAVT